MRALANRANWSYGESDNTLDWTDHVDDVVRKVTLADTNVVTLFSAGCNCNPGNIALDQNAGQLYWGQEQSVTMPNRDALMRMNIDGSDPTVLVTNLGSVAGVTLVPFTQAIDFLRIEIGPPDRLTWWGACTETPIAIEGAT